MKKGFSFFIGLVLAVTFAASVKAQQVPFYTHYYINPFIYNPSYAGTNNLWNTYVVHHSQWAGFPGAPVTSALTVDGPIKSKKIGVGLNLISDATGITNKLGVSTSYSYRTNLSENQQLFFGLSVGLLNTQIDFSKQKVIDETEADISRMDVVKTAFDASFGMNYNFKNLNIGFAVPQILNNFSSNINDQNPRANTLARTYLTTLKYTFTLNADQGLTAYPLVMLRTYPGAPFQYDLNAVVNWQKYGWFAVSYKSDYATTLNLGIRFNSLSAGYAYDLITNPIGPYAGPSSEFILGFSFGVTPKKKDEAKLAEEKRATISRGKPETTVYERKSNDSLEQRILERMDRLEKLYKGTNIDNVNVGQLYRLNTINFSMKSSELDSKSHKTLNDLIEFLNENPSVKIEIDGHTDDVGEPENNMALSEKRAKLIYDYLIEKGIDADRLSYKFFGESRPIIEGTSNKIRAMNRRTEILILEK